MTRPLTLSELARHVAGQVDGDPAYRVMRVASLQQAGQSDIAFYSGDRYQDDLQSTGAGAVILTAAHTAYYPGNKILVDDPYAAFACITQLLHPDPVPDPGIHPTALVHASAKIDPSAVIGAWNTIEAGAMIGPGVVIGAYSYIGERCGIAENTRIDPQCTVYHDTRIGRRCRISAGVVIGGPGFGYVHDGSRWLRQPQLGRVVIGDDVDIGAMTAIDRGTLDDTVIGDGVKMDNQIQIAHNVIVGEHTIMAGKVGIAGSAVVGKRCRLGGRCSIGGHLTLVDDVTVTATSMVSRSLLQPGVYSSTLTVLENRRWRKVLARIHRLQELARRIAAVEKKLE